MRKVMMFQVDAFTTTPFAGNPAGVVPHADGLTDREMQLIARELNNPETAFVLPGTEPGHDMLLRYFTPTVEVAFCGHATIATHYVLAHALGHAIGTVRQQSGAGTITITTRRTETGDVKVFMKQRPPVFGPPLDAGAVARITSALRLPQDSVLAGAPVQSVDTGHAKLVMPLVSRDAVLRAQPDLNALADLSAKLDFNGLFIFALDGGAADVLTTCRMFAPAIGIAEDPVTGSGQGPLGAYLVKHGLVDHDGHVYAFRSTQGEAIGRQGFATVRVEISGNEPVAVDVGEDAVIVMTGELSV
jgi:PhzF family phenazine biosynthesis protein